MTNNSQNPLNQYFRDIAIYIKLPSQGIYSAEGDIETTPSGELEVYPMTTSDELLFKSPDALLNGESVAKVIQSCVPGIKNVYDLPMNDVEVILLAIKHSTYGDQMDFQANCPECELEKAFGISIEAALSNVDVLEKEEHVYLKDLVLKVRPYTYASSVQAAILAFNEGKFLQMLTEEDLSEEEKAGKAAESYKKAVKLTVDLLTTCIMGVYDKEGQLLTDKEEHIKEWLENSSRKEIKKVEETVKKLNETGVNKDVELVCDACSHEWTTQIEFDPSSFFE